MLGFLFCLFWEQGETNRVNAVYFLFSLKRCIYRLVCCVSWNWLGKVSLGIARKLGLSGTELLQRSIQDGKKYQIRFVGLN